MSRNAGNDENTHLQAVSGLPNSPLPAFLDITGNIMFCFKCLG